MPTDKSLIMDLFVLVCRQALHTLTTCEPPPLYLAKNACATFRLQTARRRKCEKYFITDVFGKFTVCRHAVVAIS